jgi:ABC-2 type transport system ATP-binding protein
MNTIIEVQDLTHRYGRRTIYEGLNFALRPGRILALLEKNGGGQDHPDPDPHGVFRPAGGRCTVFGEDSHDLSPATRRRIGLLFEGHVTYAFMSIEQIERFYRPFYPDRDRGRYYRMVDKLRLPHDHLIRNMSCGQRSRVVLGLLMAQHRPSC